MKRLILVFMLLGAMILAGCGESWERTMKDLQSEFGGGLYRVMKVYDGDGDLLETYEGQFDIQDSGVPRLLFEKDGKRTIIYDFHQGVVTVQEL